MAGLYIVTFKEKCIKERERLTTKTGKSIGKVIPGIGFVPNKNYRLYLGEDSQDDITIFGYGQYALIEMVAKDMPGFLKESFPMDVHGGYESSNPQTFMYGDASGMHGACYEKSTICPLVSSLMVSCKLRGMEIYYKF